MGKSTTDKQSEALLKELSETQQRRHKFDVLKITFVADLYGFSFIQIQDIMTFYQTLYFVPLVAMFFDLLIMGEHFSIKRIGADLRLYSGSKTEVSWNERIASGGNLEIPAHA